MISSNTSIIRQRGTNTLGFTPFIEYEYSKSEPFCLIERVWEKDNIVFLIIIFQKHLSELKAQVVTVVVMGKTEIQFLFGQSLFICG